MGKDSEFSFLGLLSNSVATPSLGELRCTRGPSGSAFADMARTRGASHGAAPCPPGAGSLAAGPTAARGASCGWRKAALSALGSACLQRMMEMQDGDKA
mmetsp:Transcript_91876/g.168484  ORF Transcript_91876/g.168484 Transcript_91876/m.168484 type:complete len:99 (-) Transcript_91876:9-305(-)